MSIEASWPPLPTLRARKPAARAQLLFDRRAQHAPVGRMGRALAVDLEPRVAAGEVAIGEAERGQRAAETLRVGLLHLEAGLERHAAQRGADRVGLHPER